jgi:AraC-like DNA-binding protein
MAGLESISPPKPATRVALPGRMRHDPCDDLSRHRHDQAFAAIVLTGGYVEAGDTGRHRVRAGDVVLHRAYESHLDRFEGTGAEVLVLPLPDGWRGPARATIDDPDMLARLAERDIHEAGAALAEAFRPAVRDAIDWPDLLAQALQDDPDLRLGAWAERNGLCLGSISRGFRKVYGVTPVAFRLTQRTLMALDAILHSGAPLSLVAHACGFADQAHMSRAIAMLTGLPPALTRRRATARLARTLAPLGGGKAENRQ